MDPEKDSVRLRAACDRCHSQKLRCPKPDGAEICDRCRRADRPCVFSPFRQKKEPRRANEKARESMNTQLFHLEERIDSITEIHKRSLVGMKRKRNILTPPRDCGPDDLFLPVSTLPPIDPYFSFPEVSGSDWISDSFRLNEFGMDPTLDDLGLELGNTFSPIDFTSPEVEWVNNDLQGPKSLELLRFPNAPIDLQENNMSTALSAGPSLGLPPPPLWNNRSPRFEWEKPIIVAHPTNSYSQKNLIRQLSELSVGLYDHLSTVPPQSIHDPIPEGSNLREEKHTGYSVDETFRLTQELIDVYPVFINTFLDKRTCHEDDSTIPMPDFSGGAPDIDLLRSIKSQHDVEKAAEIGHQDHASILLLLSCHIRIINIYEELFKHMLMCINGAYREINFRQAMYMLPVVKIGTFTPPSSTAIPLQLILLLRQASQLSEAASELAAHLKGSQNERSRIGDDDAGDDAAILSLVMAEKVKRRAKNMSQQFNSVKARFLSPNFSRMAN